MSSAQPLNCGHVAVSGRARSSGPKELHSFEPRGTMTSRAGVLPYEPRENRREARALGACISMSELKRPRSHTIRNRALGDH
jgi:hypothetical protein